MTNKLLIIDHSTSANIINQHIEDPLNTYTLYLPHRKTKQHLTKLVEETRLKTTIPKDNHITIPIQSIIQKTWRIIKFYTANGANSKAETNQTRLTNITAAINKIIIHDQALMLDASIHNLTEISINSK